MIKARWTIVGALACTLVAGGCGRDDNMGSAEGDEEGAVPSGAIVAPTDAPSAANPSAAGAPIDSADTSAVTGTAGVDSVTPVVGK